MDATDVVATVVQAPKKKKVNHKKAQVAEKTGRVQQILDRMGKKMRALREKKGMSLEAMADRAKCSVSYVSMLERGQREPSLESAIHIAKALGINPAQLYDFS